MLLPRLVTARGYSLVSTAKLGYRMGFLPARLRVPMSRGTERMYRVLHALGYKTSISWNSSSHSMAPNSLSTLHLLSGVSKVMNAPTASNQRSSLVPAAERETTAVRKNSAVEQNPRQLLRLPPIKGDGGGKPDRRRNGGATTAAAPSEAAERPGNAARARMREALARRVAWRVLKRGAPSPSPDERNGNQNVLTCCCARLPPGSRCALHQAGAPNRSWMRTQRIGGRGEVAGEAVVALPRTCGRRGGTWAFSEYARWRRHVWMPTRFYLDRLEQH